MGERYLDAVEVDGSKPSVPTICHHLFMIYREGLFSSFID